MSGTPSNFKKQYTVWYKETFVPACAAYAVAYDWARDSAYIKDKAPAEEARLKIEKPGIKNDPTPERLKKARDAFAKADTFLPKTSNLAPPIDGGSSVQIPTLIKDAEEDAKDDENKFWETLTSKHHIVLNRTVNGRTAAGYETPIVDGAKLFARVFEAFMAIDPEGDFADLFGLWSMTRTEEMSFLWDLPGAPDPMLFNVLFSTFYTSPEVRQADAHSKLDESKYEGASTRSLIATFDGFYKMFAATAGVGGTDVGQGWKGWTNRPLFYSAPQRGWEEFDSALEQVIRTRVDLDKMKGEFDLYQRYIIGKAQEPDAGDSPPPAPVPYAMTIARSKSAAAWAATGAPWDGVEGLLNPEIGPNVRDKNDDPGVAGVYYAKGETLFDVFQQMVLDIGRNSTFKARQQPPGAKVPDLSHYDGILYRILYGLQDPEPPPLVEPVAVPGGDAGPGGGESAPQNFDKRELSDKEVHSIDLQCYLLENIKELASLREKLDYHTLGKITDAMPGNIISKINHGAPTETEVGSDSTSPAWPPLQAGPDSEAYWLQNMCPDIWGLMTPHIELYRVDYSRDNPGNLIPIDEKRIPFKNFVDSKDISEITQGTYGRIGGAGIKSFSWSLDGVQPAEVDNMISAKLVMHFQSVYDLFRYNKVHPDDPKSDAYQAGILDHAGYLDLIIGSGTTVSQGKDPKPEDKKGQELDVCAEFRQKYDGANFRIKAIVGWATPPNFKDLKIPGYTSDTLESIAKAITESRVALFLQIVSHQINFQQDGTLELDIDYQASLSGIMRAPDADIFIAKEINSEELKGLQKEATELEWKAADYEKASEKDKTARQKEVEENTKKQIAIMRQNRMHKYSVFLKNLQAKNKVYGIRVPSKDLLNPLREMDEAERAQEAKKRQATGITTTSGTAAKNADSSGEFQEQVESETTTEATDEKTQNATLKAMADNVGIFNTGNQDNVLVPYFYLGDLIDVLFKDRLDHLVREEGKQTSVMQMILGTVELLDPLQAFQIKNVSIECPGGNAPVVRRISEIDPLRLKKVTGITTFMNLGSIPISIDKFNEWFLNNVIRAKKDSYFLLNFVKDLCADLISGAYSELCFEDIFKFNVRFDSANFRMADRFAGKPNITIEDLARSSRKAKKRDKMRLTKESKHGANIPTVMLYCVDSRPNVGDRASDMSEGIYHYFIGGRCGLAKEIQFNRQDMPFYREARISKDGSLGAQQLKELYTVSMSMVGNNLHKNGTYVYIDPIAIGAGSSRAVGGIPNIARLIGLGGYFLVTGVKHEVSDSGFNTSVDAMQEMSAFDIAANEKITALAHPAGSGSGEKKPEQSTSSTSDEDHYMRELEAQQSLEKEDGSDGGAPLTGDASGRTTGDAAEAPYETDTRSDEEKSESLEARLAVATGLAGGVSREETLAKRKAQQEATAADQAAFDAEEQRRADAGLPSQEEERQAELDAEEGF